MTLLDAQPFDEVRARWPGILIGAVVVGLLCSRLASLELPLQATGTCRYEILRRT